MTRVIMNGCNGKMGQCITEICKNDPEITIVAGIDLYNGIKNDYLLTEEEKQAIFSKNAKKLLNLL